MCFAVQPSNCYGTAVRAERAIRPDPRLKPFASGVFIVKDRIVKVAGRTRAPFLSLEYRNLALLCQRYSCPRTCEMSPSQLYVSTELSHFVGKGKTENEQYELLVEKILKPGWVR
jgi:hypothetical protein